MSAQDLNNLVQFWEWNPFMDLVFFIIVFGLMGLFWLWTRSGRDRKHEADVLARNVEDFAGTIQESNGKMPRFLLIFYVVIAVAIVGYQLVTLYFGYDY